MMDNPHNFIMTDFIIFGHGNYNSLGVLHALSEENKIPFILNIGKSRDKKNGNIIGYSKFCQHLKEVNSEEEGVNWLIENKNLFPKGTLIYPTGDKEVIAIDRCFDQLIVHYIFPNCVKKGEITKLMDKHLQIELAEKYGLRILKSQYLNDDSFDFKKVEYPCMIKALNSTTGSKADMKICNNEHELKNHLLEVRTSKDYIIQQYISNEADLLFLGLALPNGEIVIPALVKKPGVSPTGEYSHAISTTDINSYLPEKKYVIEFVKALNYAGPFSIEFGLEKGKNYFFEINLRNDGTSHYPLGLGVNIPMLFYNSIIGKKIQVSWDILEYKMIDEVADIRRVLSQELNFLQWLREFKNAGTYKYYHSSDKQLLKVIFLMFLNRFTSKLARLIKK